MRAKPRKKTAPKRKRQRAVKSRPSRAREREAVVDTATAELRLRCLELAVPSSRATADVADTTTSRIVESAREFFAFVAGGKGA